MHKVIYCVREILPADLPTVRNEDGTERPATEAELLDLGMQPLGDDLYSCAEQYHSQVIETETARERVWFPAGTTPDPATLASLPKSPEHCAKKMGCGKLLTAGQLRQRYRELPADVRPKAMRARVFRSEAVNVQEAVTTSLEEQRLAFLEHVGEVRADLASDRAKLTEARRLAALPTNDIHPETVRMVEVLAGDDVVEEENLIPHAWAGER